MSMRDAVIFCLAIIVAGSAAAADAPAKTVVYLGATLIDSAASSARPNIAIVTAGDRIVAVRPAEQYEQKPGDEVVDVRGKFVVPGLMNTHVTWQRSPIRRSRGLTCAASCIAASRRCATWPAMSGCWRN
jgi:imidazolonepropionase-like amidohydrolase